MSVVTAFLLAAAVAQGAPTDAPAEPARGAQVDSARIAVTILRPAVLKGGVLTTDGNAPRSQRRSDGGAISYAFE